MAGIFLAAGSTLFGIAMLRTAVTSKPFAWLTVILGLAALVGIGVISIAHDNPNDYAFVILVVVLPFLLGWRVFNLSRASEAFTGSLRDAVHRESRRAPLGSAGGPPSSLVTG